MMKKKNKLLSIALCMLLFATTLPVIEAENLSEIFQNSEKDKAVEFTVYEYKIDGTVEKRLVYISQEDAKELQVKLSHVKNSEQRFSVFKQFGIIQDEKTLEPLKESIEDVKKQFRSANDQIEKQIKGLTKTPVLTFKKRNSAEPHLFGMILCSVMVRSSPWEMKTIQIGPLSNLISRLNYIVYLLTYIPGPFGGALSIPWSSFVIAISADGDYGGIEPEFMIFGLLDDRHVWGFFRLLLFGFVGFVIQPPDNNPWGLLEEVNGFCLATIGCIYW